MKKKHAVGKKFIQESVIGFGFLNGIWINVGLNPESEIYNMIASGLSAALPDYGTWIVIAIAFLSFGLLIKSVFSAYNIGGNLGIIAVSLAFVGGVILNTEGFVLLIIAAILGYTGCVINKFI